MVLEVLRRRASAGATAAESTDVLPEDGGEAPPTPTGESRPIHPHPRLRLILIGVTLVLTAILLFARLGHYVLWDDEAATALGAKAIMETGRNSALIDHGNIVAYHNGSALQGFNNVLEPLLPPYLTAAMFEMFGMNSLAARFPFALFGFGTVALMLLWARRESWQVLAVLGMALVGNVSLYLYSRNCRYYAPAIFFSVALAYLYRRRKPTMGSALAFAALSILLFTSNCLDYAAFYACLGLDYFIWQRRRRPLSWPQLLCVFLPQGIINGTILAIWNPLRTAHAENILHNTLLNKLTLFYLQWHDANLCEQMCLPLLVVTLGVGLAQHRTLLVRGCVAMVVYIVAVTALSPQLISDANTADVRYLTPIIPLAIGLEVATLCILLRRWTLPLIAVSLVVFGTNFVNGGFLLPGGARSTLGSYVRELADPLDEPYGVVSDWVKKNVPAGKSVLVGPDYACYPLMFYAPEVVYAWQLNWPPRPEYAGLPVIHFAEHGVPDFLVAFGPYLPKMERAIGRMDVPNTRYVLVATINIFWRHPNRPEILCHCFEPIVGFPDKHAIHVYKRTTILPRPDQPETVGKLLSPKPGADDSP